MDTPPKVFRLLLTSALLLAILASFNLVAQIETDAEASIIGGSLVMFALSTAISAILVSIDNDRIRREQEDV